MQKIRATRTLSTILSHYGMASNFELWSFLYLFNHSSRIYNLFLFRFPRNGRWRKMSWERSVSRRGYVWTRLFSPDNSNVPRARYDTQKEPYTRVKIRERYVHSLRSRVEHWRVVSLGPLVLGATVARRDAFHPHSQLQPFVVLARQPAGSLKTGGTFHGSSSLMDLIFPFPIARFNNYATHCMYSLFPCCGFYLKCV